MMDILNLGYDSNRYPDGVQDFATLRREGMVYIDKTEYIYHITRKSKSYFLSRPRRFGKSLLLSTISAYFEGERELFRNLAIDKLEQDWGTHPVIRIDLSQGIFTNRKEAITELSNQLHFNASRLEIPLQLTDVIGKFQELVSEAYRKFGQGVVILIDEYDKPLLETMYESEETHKDVQDLMRGFYGCVKSAAPYLRFVMITGITKVSHVNVFSGLNNLTDISLEPWCNAICGISESEMQSYFSDDMRIFAERNNMSEDEARAGFKHYYDGYHFASQGENIYNPYSVMRAFQSMRFSNYWFTTGLPNHIVKALSHYDLNFDSLDGRMVTENILTGIPTTDSNPVGLLYQSGYLTIKDFDDDLYTVGFPNKEVKSVFLSQLP